MPEEIADRMAANQVELSICRLDSLSTLPCVAVRLVSALSQAQFSPSALAETVESDPALTAKVFSLLHQQDVSFTDEKPSVRLALGKLPPEVIRSAFLSVKIFGGFDLGYATDNNKIQARKQLVQHSLAVAWCAKNIAEIVSPQMDLQLAYSAGLLHDIGKLAIQDAMPKSFSRIAEEAKSQSCCTCTIEQKYLGLDHTILGKRLAQSWHLPDAINLAIWLHHSDTAIISESMLEVRIAQIVQLADSIAIQCGIGDSGSKSQIAAEQLAHSLGINLEQLEQIRGQLPAAVEQKFKALGLNLLSLRRTEATYCNAVQAAAAKFAKDNSKLSLENRRLQTTSSHFDFVRDFLLSIDCNALPIDIAENFAVRWQKFYQTGLVCLYLVPPGGSQKLEAVIVETLGKAKPVYLNAPADLASIPKVVANNFSILDAGDYIDWLFEQLDLEFDLSQTKLVPLLSGGRAIGAIVFELRYPADAETLREDFQTVSSIAGAVLDMACACYGQQRFAEQFARLSSLVPRLSSIHEPLGDLRQAIGEIAGGAAHELNNPLSVISGRAQLLAEAETDAEKERMLKQIQENTAEISAIINDLMTYANPPTPRATETDIKQILDEAIALTSQKSQIANHKSQIADVQIEIADGLKEVFVDSAQIASAIANIICNSLESYTGKIGPVRIIAAAFGPPDERRVKLQISDTGCGMDAETVKKATQPFFSARPAGRGRGMGLPHAQRLVESNGGSLEITSQPGSGTTVTILLPCNKISA